ncbi:MAG TPA: hypothetical protein EYP90_09415 [Chromatiaceae bacterium]|nr:hypothetical protein [Chromatiaceae bacterium]
MANQNSTRRSIKASVKDAAWKLLEKTVKTPSARELLDSKERFNRHRLLQRHGYATPAQVRAAHAPVAEAMR